MFLAKIAFACAKLRCKLKKLSAKYGGFLFYLQNLATLSFTIRR